MPGWISTNRTKQKEAILRYTKVTKAFHCFHHQLRMIRRFEQSDSAILHHERAAWLGRRHLRPLIINSEILNTSDPLYFTGRLLNVHLRELLLDCIVSWRFLWSLRYILGESPLLKTMKDALTLPIVCRGKCDDQNEVMIDRKSPFWKRYR